MKRDDLERYIGGNVEITLFDDKVIDGVLYKTGTERYKDNPNLYLRPKFYVLEKGDDFSCIFRSSHVKKLVSKGVLC